MMRMVAVFQTSLMVVITRHQQKFPQDLAKKIFSNH
jgi:hypothetical protein